MHAGFRCIGLIALGVAAVTVPAEAKNIHLGPYSKNVIEDSCGRAGGRVYGTHDDSAEYGCKSAQGSVVCTVDSDPNAAPDCIAVVSDTAAVTGNALDVILGIRRSGVPQKIGAMDARIQP